MADKGIFLKVKFVSLADEARTIRRYEAAQKRTARRAHETEHLDTEQQAWSTYEQLRNHRINVVRPEARATHLAQAYIKGRKYRDIETHAEFLPPYVESNLMNRVATLIRKYGPVNYGPEWSEELRKESQKKALVDVKAWMSEPEPERIPAPKKPKRKFVKVTMNGKDTWIPDASHLFADEVSV